MIVAHIDGDLYEARWPGKRGLITYRFPRSIGRSVAMIRIAYYIDGFSNGAVLPIRSINHGAFGDTAAVSSIYRCTKRLSRSWVFG